MVHILSIDLQADVSDFKDHEVENIYRGIPRHVLISKVPLNKKKDRWVAWFILKTLFFFAQIKLFLVMNITSRSLAHIRNRSRNV